MPYNVARQVKKVFSIVEKRDDGKRLYKRRKECGGSPKHVMLEVGMCLVFDLVVGSTALVLFFFFCYLLPLIIMLQVIIEEINTHYYPRKNQL